MLLVALAAPSAPAHASDPRFWEVVRVGGAALRALDGAAIDRLAVFACDPARCRPIPFQVDERDAAGRWVLDQGTAAGADNPPRVLDANDVLLFMAGDGGQRAPRPPIPPGAARVVEVALEDPLHYPTRWVYVAEYGGATPRPLKRYVSYDHRTDRISGQRVTLGFEAGVPQYLSLERGGPNVLDRLKARATATFLWGLVKITRGDGQLISGPVSWRAGPIRVIRRQAHAVRIGFGIRSPAFGSDTYFYRDFAELPVSLRLRVPPRYFFADISVHSQLDFRSLPGTWRFLAPGLAAPLAVTCGDSAAAPSVGDLPGHWFALEGPAVTLVERLRPSQSLAAVQARIWFAADPDLSDPPEAVRGQCPGAGFVLEGWDRVEGGQHALSSTSWAVPAGTDVGAFLALVDAPLRVRLRALAPDASDARQPRRD